MEYVAMMRLLVFWRITAQKGCRMIYVAQRLPDFRHGIEGNGVSVFCGAGV